MMTMLNAAARATPAPSGAPTGAAVPKPAPQATSAVVPHPASAQRPLVKERSDKAPEFHVLGAGGTPGATGVAAAQSQVSVPLDQFSKESGPDAAVQTAGGVVNVHAVFQLDAKTRELTVAIVNEEGQLVRMIPPESVARMIAAMTAYRGR